MPSLHNMISFLVFGLLFAANLHLSDAQIGVLYGTNGNNLPAPAEVVGILASNKISKVRILEPNKDILTALKGKNIEVLLGVSNTDSGIINERQAPGAEKWVAENIKPYVPDVKIKYLVVGNDLSINNDYRAIAFTNNVTMTYLHDALQKHELTDIKVTASLDFSMLKQVKESMPLPSTGELVFPSSQEYLSTAIIPFLSKYGYPLMVSINPYYELITHPDLKPEYALFTAKDGGVKDGKYTYENTFDLMLDSLYTVLEKLNKTFDLEIIVSETGWPSAGGVAASLENEKMYVTNLVQHVNKGTPKRPNKPVQVYLNMFDENQKGEPEIEKHFGVCSSDGKLKFPVAFVPSA